MADETPDSGYTTRPLTADTWGDFANLVEANNGVWGGCWCVGFHPEGVHHSVGVKSTFTVQRMSEIRVPARKHVRVTLTWKRIWQDGIVNLRTTQGVDVAVPYSLTVDLGFDKKTDDVS